MERIVEIIMAVGVLMSGFIIMFWMGRKIEPLPKDKQPKEADYVG